MSSIENSKVLVKNSTDLYLQVSQFLNIPYEVVKRVYDSFCNCCLEYVKQGNSFFLTSDYYIRVKSKDDLYKQSSGTIKPFGLIVKTVSEETSVSYYTVKSIIDNLVELATAYANKGYSSRLLGLVSFKKVDDELKLSVGSTIKYIRQSNNLKVLAKPVGRILVKTANV